METFVYQLCRHSKRDLGIDPLVVHLNSEVSEFRCEDYEGIAVVRAPTKHYLDIWTWPPNLREYVEGCDLIHVHDFRMSGITVSMALQRRGRPMVLSTHGGFFHTGRGSLLKSVYYRTLLPRVLSRYRAILASSVSDYEMVGRLHPTVMRIDNGIDYEKFAAVPTLIADPPNFIYFGRFARNKRMDWLFQTFSALADLGVPFRLFMTGPESAETKGDLLRHLAATKISERIELQFDADDARLQQLLEGATYFVLASEYEGFGLAAVEAMAAARVVLLNRIEPFSTFVELGKNGFLIDFSNPEQAATQIRAVMALDLEAKRNIAARARQRARDFSWTSRVLEFKEVYDAVMVAS
ncbi:MAG TPA: glycosyltransferase family 4 protein [Stellaceae bacterium]|nr:glycosyltransferase family 4 protein [Stellaceae bacterium]